MLSRYNAIRARRARGEDQGFSLIELLVVVVIMGILIAIAVPVYLNYQNNAKKKAVEADVRNAIPAVEQCAADNGGALGSLTYAAATPTTAGSVTCGSAVQNVNASDGVILKFNVVGTNGGYSIEGSRSDPAYTVTYDSSTGHTTKS